MNGIGGNLTADVQIKTSVLNEIGEGEITWETVQSLTGWLDYMTGNVNHSNFNSKIEESTHVFVGDYVQLNEEITEENSRMLINGKVYNILLIDDPMELHEQLEIYLKFTGGQNG